MRPEDLPIQVTLEWPAGVIQRGSATQPNIQEFAKDGKRYVTATVELDPPFNHLAHAKAALDRLDKESAMSEYTSEDFKNARFAEHENGRAAMRPQPGRLWHLGSVHMGDYDMAADGWRPVVEADHPARPLAGYRAQVKELREKVRDLERAPLTLDTLREAWENADEATECSPIREGDVVIVRRHGGGFTVEPADRILSGQTHGRERILHRAPRREPWADLADVLRAWDEEPMDADLMGRARWLHERGVRVTGGDDDE